MALNITCLTFYTLHSTTLSPNGGKDITIYTKNATASIEGFMLQIRYDCDRYDESLDKRPVGQFLVRRNDPFECVDCHFSGNRDRINGREVFCSR